MSINLSAKTEFDFINRLKSFPLAEKIGDDCAVLSKDSKTDLVITTDLLAEDIDFRLSWTNPEFLGHKALTVSLSDIAAMGAKPVWAMLSIGVPQKIWKTDFVEKFYQGWFDLAKKFDVELVGGDVSKTPDKIVIDSIAAGEVRKGKAVLRSGARARDLIFVTGKLGGAAAGLQLLEDGEKLEKSKCKNLLLRQLKPNPQTEIGQILMVNNLATAMIDLSDGLSSDLTHLCLASKTGAKIFANKIPFERNLRIVTNTFDEKLNFALNGGEDFELLFAVSEKNIFRLENELKNHTFTHIGEMAANVEEIELISNHKRMVLQPKGFRHF